MATAADPSLDRLPIDPCCIFISQGGMWGTQRGGAAAGHVLGLENARGSALRDRWAERGTEDS